MFDVDWWDVQNTLMAELLSECLFVFHLAPGSASSGTGREQLRFFLSHADVLSRLMMPYGPVRKPDTLVMVKRFTSDVSAVRFPGDFRIENGNNGGGFTSHEAINFCDDA